MPPYVWLRDDRVTATPTGRVGDSPAPRLWRAGPLGADFKLEEVQPRLTAETIAFLGERAVARDARPFFALLSLASPHTPTLATGEFAGSTPTPYGDFVRQVDADVGRILAELDRLDLARNTLVVFTTDNGYAPAGDIPNHRSLGHDSSGGFRGANSDYYEGGHRVPFLVRGPGVAAAGSRSAEVVGHLDLFATMAEVLGVTLPAEVAEDSASFLPVLQGQPARAGVREGLVHHSSEGEFSIRVGRWKLILAPGSGGWGRPTGGLIAPATRLQGRRSGWPPALAMLHHHAWAPPCQLRFWGGGGLWRLRRVHGFSARPAPAARRPPPRWPGSRRGCR
jgi:hypothetical protein